MAQSEISKPIHRQSNQKNFHLICAFCRHRGHTIDRCNMHADILQRSAALTTSEFVPSSDAASFDPVSLTTYLQHSRSASPFQSGSSSVFQCIQFCSFCDTRYLF